MKADFHPELRRIARFLPRNAFTRRTMPEAYRLIRVLYRFIDPD